MAYHNPDIARVSTALKNRFAELDDKKSILRDPQLANLYAQIKNIPDNEKASFGQEVNSLKIELQAMVEEQAHLGEEVLEIDVTAPFDVNMQTADRPAIFSAEHGSVHPLMAELDRLLNILAKMGFSAVESREIDDDFHMFGSLNFPEGHPARFDYDTFMTDEGLIAPAHTSTMQNRILKTGKHDLEAGKGLRVVIPGRVFRNEDLDARHEHTFYQLEGVYVDKGVNAGHLITTLKTFLENYYEQELDVKTQPFYFPFTEPSFEFAMSCPFCKKTGCHICSHTGWIEILGCGMIHPNVLKEADIDPEIYTGFAWGGGIDRLVMMKYGVEDVRHFHSGNLKFLRQFS